MDIISCDRCGVVLDKDKIIFPDTRNEYGEIIDGCAVWDGEDFVSRVDCPVCEGDIIDN